MGLMDAVSRGISAAGYAGGDLYARGALEDQRATIQAERDARLAELAEQSGIRSEERKNAPLNRIGASARAKMAEEVPLEAAPLTSLSGTNGAGEKFGFNGDLRAVRQAIDQMPEGEDKTAALAQLQSQVSTDTSAAAASVQGKTRRRSSEEAFDAALADAKLNDPVAYAAGRPLSTERTVTVADGASIIDPKTGKVIFSNSDSKAAREEMREDRRDARSAAAEDGRDRRQQAALAAAEARARYQTDGRVPSGYRVSKDGNLEFIPGGPGDPNTKPAGGKPLNEGQSKALLFGTRMQAANEILDTLAEGGRTVSTPGANGIAGPAVNLVNSEQGQQLDQAKRDFLNAVLRRESGAVIAESEFDNGNKQYFPQVGDSPKVIAQKRDNRLLAQRGILAEVPDGEARVAQVRGTSPQPEKRGGATGGWGIRELK